MPVRARSSRKRTGARPPAPEPSLVLAGRTWYRGRLQPIEIGVDAEGFISAIGRNLRGGDRHDVGDRLLLPAATDLHVHFRHPDAARGNESWGTGTVQAALAGVGLVGEMPNSEPPVTTPGRLIERREAGAGHLAVDMLLYGALTTVARVGPLSKECGAFKLYMSPTTAVDPDPSPEEPLGERLAAVAATGLPLSVHAEDPGRFDPSVRAVDVPGWNAARPPEAERSAVEALLAAAGPGLRLHVAHVTLPDLAARLHAAGHSFEVTPHHLLFAARAGLDSRFKVNPPLREEPERAGLLERFLAGEVPCVATDHAPHPLEAKARPFPLAPSGMPGVLTGLPVLLARVRDGSIPLEVVLRAACDRPARWLGVPMGRIALGHRAHLLVVDPKRRRRIRAGELPIACGWTAFEGFEALFPWEHYRDGERIVDGGEYVGRSTGRFVRPEFAPLGVPAEGRVPLGSVL